MRFTYSAILGPGQRVSGTLTSNDRREAVSQLLKRGYHPLSVDAAAEGRRGLGVLGYRVKPSALAVFTRQLAVLLKAGTPLPRALGTLREQCRHRGLQRVTQEIEEALLRDARSFADALGDHPRVFSGTYRGIVGAGEEGGNLAEVLDDLAGHLAESTRTRGKVLNAFIYPLFLVVLGAAAVFILMTFVIPRFQDLFESLGQDLPLPTQVLIALSRFVVAWWWALVGGGACLILACLMLLRRRPIRQQADRLLLRVPVLGDLLLKLEVVQIARTLGTLFGSGVPILEAMRVTSKTVKNLAVKDTFEGMAAKVANGDELAVAVEQARIYPPLMVSLIRTGEEAGELPQMLKELSTICEEEADRAVTRAVRLLEPVLIVVLGGTIASIVAAVMLPVFQASALAGQ